MSNEYFKLMGDWPEELNKHAEQIRKDRDGNQMDADALSAAAKRIADLEAKLATKESEARTLAQANADNERELKDRIAKLETKLKAANERAEWYRTARISGG